MMECVTNRCQSWTFVDGVIAFLVLFVCFDVRKRAIAFAVGLVLHSDYLLLLVLIVVHLSAVSQSTVARRRHLAIGTGDSVSWIFNVSGRFRLFLQTVKAIRVDCDLSSCIAAKLCSNS